MSATVLVVEDNPITRKLFRVTLESEGYLVVEAGDARTALDLAERSRPTIVLQDYVLPDMNGADLARELRMLPGLGEIPIVMVTGIASRLDELKQMYADSGFSRVTAHPTPTPQTVVVGTKS